MYKELGNNYVIFICMFDPFDREEYIYHFENMCMEVPELFLADGSHKVFVNVWGEKGYINPELKCFLNYLKSPERFRAEGENNCLVSYAIEEVAKGRRNKEWRLSYMTLMTRYNEFLAEGRQEGLAEGEKLFASLAEILLREGKIMELNRAITDKAYRVELYRQFEILK